VVKPAQRADDGRLRADLRVPVRQDKFKDLKTDDTVKG